MGSAPGDAKLSEGTNHCIWRWVSSPVQVQREADVSNLGDLLLHSLDELEEIAAENSIGTVLMGVGDAHRVIVWQCDYALVRCNPIKLGQAATQRSRLLCQLE
jgi:hypothetical protein